MTVMNDLERAIAMAEASKGNYLLFATDSEDEKAKQVFQDMATDMDRHVQILQSRKEYLDKYNHLNEKAGDGGGQQKQGGKQGQGSGQKQGGDQGQGGGQKQDGDQGQGGGGKGK